MKLSGRDLLFDFPRLTYILGPPIAQKCPERTSVLKPVIQSVHSGQTLSDGGPGK